MSKKFILLSLLGLTFTLPALGLHCLADAAPLPNSTLHALVENANAARSNVADYQWKRVDLEVRRIASAEKQVEQSAAAKSDLASEITPLRDAVLSLRSGSRSHDSTQTQAAAARVSDLCAKLLH